MDSLPPTPPIPPSRIPVSEARPAQSVAAGDEIVDCWNRIGVYGDGSCPELARFYHCRNCSVYTAAGRRLLDREPPAEYRRQWTEHFAAPKKTRVPGKVSVVIFRIGSEWLALAVRAFQEVAERRRVHSLPHRKNEIVLGLVNIRGELLLCVSVGRLLGIGSGPEEVGLIQERLMVTEWQGSLLTFPVNEVHGMHRLHPSELREAPATVAKSNPNFTRGVFEWRGGVAGFLDEDPLFSALNRSLA